MESRIRIFLLRSLCLIACVAVVSGCSGRGAVRGSDREPVIDPDVERRDIKRPKIGSNDFEFGAFFGLKSVEDWETNTTYGLRGAYHISESFFVEGTYGVTTVGRTSAEIIDPNLNLISDDGRDFEYYDLSLGWNLLPGEVFIGRSLAFPTAFYLSAGAGNTSFADDDFFTVVIGGGYRVLLTRWMALHFDVRDHIFSADTLGQPRDEKTTHNIEMTIGLTGFF